MTTAVAVGVQARVATAHQRGELVKSRWAGAAGSGPTSTSLSRSAWRMNRPRKQLVRRITRCEASGQGMNHGCSFSMFESQEMLNKYGEDKEAKKEVELWWLDLPYVLCIWLITNSSDDDNNNQQQSGFYSLDMTPDFAGASEGDPSTQPTYNHTVAFQDQKDALNFCGLLLSERYSADVIPVAPKDLYQDAKEQGLKVTVIKKGQLGLVPGQALDDVEQRLVEIGSSIYWEELERARSIDIDAFLDEGLGYGRPSR